MNKQQFLGAIGERLRGLSRGDIAKSLDYYSEMIDDRMEDGLMEEEAVAAMGSVDDIVSQILMDTPLPKLVRAKAKPSRALRSWEIVLLVLGSPIWGSLLLGAAAVLLALYGAVWVVVIAFYSADLGIGVCALACLFGAAAVVFTDGLGGALFCFGAGLICGGAAVLIFFGCNLLAAGVIRLSGFLVCKVKALFIRKGEAV